EERSMIGTPGSASTSSGKVGPHMLSRAVVVTMIGNCRALAAFGQRHHVVLQLSRRIVANAGHEADLVVNEDQGRIGSDMTLSCNGARPAGDLQGLRLADLLGRSRFCRQGPQPYQQRLPDSLGDDWICGVDS